MKTGQDVMVKPDAQLPDRIKHYAGHIGTVIQADGHHDSINTVRFADNSHVMLCDSDLIKLS